MMVVMAGTSKALSVRFEEAVARAARESIERDDSAAESLMKYTEATFAYEPPFYAPPHLREVAAALERVERGELKKLFICMPPRHGKSMLISESFISWYLGRNPLRHVVHAGYAQGFTEHFGGKLRKKMDSVAHKAAFPDPRCWLSTEKRSVDEWQTQAGGGYLAVGAGAGVSGRTGHLIVVDDPIRGAEDADSELKRDKLWRWFKTDLSTRQTGKTPAIVIVMTRWHEDDIIGRLQKTPGWKQFEVIHHEAFDPVTDEPLAPELVSREQLLEFKDTFTPREWQALYVGRPTPDTGTTFRREWIKDALPPPRGHMRVYGASDYALSKAKSRDYTVHMVFGVDPKARLWVLDCWRGRADAKEWSEKLILMMKRWKPARWAEERGLIIKGVGPFIEDYMRREHVYVPREQFTSNADKEARAEAIAARMEMFGLYLDERKQWAQDLIGELMAFPHGTHDDMADCLSLIGRMMHRLGRGAVPPASAVKAPMNERLKRTWGDMTAQWDREDRERSLAAW